eukprot:TRINITY_DN33_c0_g1_i2.p1 TRINITY_DN33_c0_g1~~TRINITY_DN33_c0_g1_i2.p1  ORF type:complete len:289 (-),score=58.50 TRINITY_DN33_c0_g1_i2:420-1286(-)
MSDAVIHPLDTVRARLQVQRSGHEIYKSTLDAFQKTIQREGWRSLYKGFGIVVLCSVPAHALYFAGYEVSKKTFTSFSSVSQSSNSSTPPSSLSLTLSHFASGFVADIFGSFIWVPQDVIKQKIQVSQGKDMINYQNTFKAINYIYKNEGLFGFFRGFGAGIAVYGPFVGIYFALYEKIKSIAKQKLKKTADHELPFPLHLFGAAFSGGIAAAITCPLDVVKTRLQVQSKQSEEYRGILSCISKIYKEEGLKAFSKGLFARVLWISPGMAITMACYERIKISLHHSGL